MWGGTAELLSSCLGALEVDEPSINVDPGQSHAESIANVEASMRTQQFPFDWRRPDSNERALARSARDHRIERLADAGLDDHRRGGPVQASRGTSVNVGFAPLVPYFRTCTR